MIIFVQYLLKSKLTLDTNYNIIKENKYFGGGILSILSNQFTATAKDKTPCIYAIINNENNRVYVGESKTPIRRMEQHIIGLKSKTHPNKELQSDFNKGHTFVFCRLKDYTEDEPETMRYYELERMSIYRQNGIELYNSETDEQINNLLRFNSSDWKMHCLMERKRDEYYRKYFGCTYFQFRTWDMISKQKGSDDYLPWKIQCFNEKRIEEIKKEEREKRRKFLKEHKKISFYIKKNIYDKLESVTDNPEEYINMMIENFIERKC